MDFAGHSDNCRLCARFKRMNARGPIDNAAVISRSRRENQGEYDWEGPAGRNRPRFGREVRRQRGSTLFRHILRRVRHAFEREGFVSSTRGFCLVSEILCLPKSTCEFYETMPLLDLRKLCIPNWQTMSVLFGGCSLSRCAPNMTISKISW